MSIRSLIHYLQFNKWNLAFIEESLDDIVKTKTIKVHYLKGNNRKQWFADPFILDVTPTTIVCLVEELSYKTMRGRIAKLVIDRNTYKLQSIKIILDLPTHLSFPFIFRKNGKVYLMPENSSSGKSVLYTYNPSDDSLVIHNDVASRPFTDATIFSDGEKSFLITTQKPTPNGNVLDIYEFDVDSLKAGEEPITSIAFDNNCARNAGGIFKAAGRIFRPAQDCNGGYGKGVILQELKKTSKGFSFVDYCSFYPDSWTYHMGYHTFNSYEGITVVDAHGYRFPIIGRLVGLITRPLKRMMNIK